LGVATTAPGGEAARFAAKMAEKFPFLAPARCGLLVFGRLCGIGLFR
jgi:hypothetical protein